MDEQQYKCVVCSNDMRQLKAWLWQCPACNFFASNLPAAGGADIGGIEDMRRQNYKSIIDRLEKIRPIGSARILEVGCAKGWFIDEVLKRGGDIVAIEPDTANAQIAKQTGAPVIVGFFPDDLNTDERFDIIVFNDVFEHLPTPCDMARAVAGLLNPGGLAVINLPSSDGFFYRLATVLDRIGMSSPFERLWQKGLQSPHVSYFNAANLTRLVENCGGLEKLDLFHLSSATRKGLYARIRSTYSTPLALPISAGLWCATFILPLLPPDIIVGIYKRPAD